MSVKASCHLCGDFDLPAEKVLVKVYPQLPKQNYITFECPTCNAPCERRDLAESTLRELLRVGAVKKVTYFPAEILEDHYEGDPLSQDEILDFMLDLEREDDLSALAG